MYTKWLVALLVSIGLAVTSSQSTTQNVTSPSTSAPTTNSPETTTPTTTSSTPVTTKTPATTSTSSSTAAPTTSTEVPPPPTPPKPESWSGNVTDNDTICINAKFAIQIDISYNNTNGSQLLTGFTVPSNASVDQSKSHCSTNESETQAISISFTNEEYTSANLTLVFNNTDKEVSVQRVELSFVLTKELFPGFHNPSLYGQTVTFSRDGLSLFKVASSHSYVCGEARTADLGDNENGINNVKIDFVNSQVEAYIGKEKQGKFDSEIDCKSSEISDVVPIAVGAALAGLVVIVLIAYFIGRRRSRRLAYQSV